MNMSYLLLLFVLLAGPVNAESLGAAHVQFFTGCWQGEGKFQSSGRDIRATVEASETNVPGALLYVHDDLSLGRYHSTALWSQRGERTFMAEINSSGGYRIFELEQASKDKLVFTRLGQIDAVGEGAGDPVGERFTYEINDVDSYRMSFESRQDQGWKLVDYIDFTRCVYDSEKR